MTKFDAGKYSDQICDVWEDIEKKKSTDINKFVDMVGEFLTKADLKQNGWMISSIIEDYTTAYGRQPKWESILISLDDLDTAVDYCSYAKYRWKELENKIENSKNLENAIDYSTNVVQGRWDVCERMILESESVDHVMRYVYNNNFRWHEAEHIIVKDPNCAVSYSIENIENRWPEAEKSILKDIRCAEKYAEHHQFRWKEYENKIKNKPNRIVNYAQKVIRGKLPEELHNRMLMLMLDSEKKHYAEAYFDFIKNQEQDTIKYLKSLTQDEVKDLFKSINI
jgi:hypothetical protein